MHLRRKVCTKYIANENKMKLQEYLLVVFCTIAVASSASVVSRRERSIEESAQLSSRITVAEADTSRVTREADDDDAGKI